MGLRGGTGRTRTPNQAVMGRHRGLGGLELATKRLSPLAPSIDQRPACRDFVASEVPEEAGLPGVSLYSLQMAN
jgi:hypothetical protein